MKKFEIGKTYIIFVPPGWLYILEIEDVDDEHIKAGRHVFLRGCSSDSIEELAVASKAQAKKIYTDVHSGYGKFFRRDAIFHHQPSNKDPLDALHSLKAIEALKNA